MVPLTPREGWDAVKEASRAIALHLARTFPERFVATSGPKNRVGRIFIDYLRNGFGATTVAAWSLRARPGLGVSVPASWAELPTLESAAHWTLRGVGDRLKTGNTPWKDYARSARSITAAMKRLGVTRSRQAA